MPAIIVTDLTFGYEGSYDNIFEGAAFQADTDWKLGFIGRNGRGKTTFLKLLLGEMEYQGSIINSVPVRYFPFSVKDKKCSTIDVVEQMIGDFPLWELQRELSFLNVLEEVLYRPFETLSNGEQTKVLLAALFLKEGGFLLIDEPTNHLDEEGREAVSAYLNSKKGFLLVSHDRSFLDRCIDHVLVLNKTEIEVQKGNFSSWFENKSRQDQFERDQNEKLQSEIRRLNQAARRTGDWSDKIERSKFGEKVPDRGFIGHKSAKMMKRSKSIEERRKKAVDEKTRLLKNIETIESIQIRPLDYHKNTLVRLEDIAVEYDGRRVCSGISFCVNRGDRIALKGKNGSGKSSLLKIIMGENVPYSGSVEKGSQLVISYVSQDTSMLTGSLCDYIERNKINETLFKTVLKKLDVSSVQFGMNMETFSAGQKKKVLLAKSLCERAHLYIWDEPLNYIDIFSRMQLEELLKEFTPTLLFVEHDSTFTKNIATGFLDLG